MELSLWILFFGFLAFAAKLRGGGEVYRRLYEGSYRSAKQLVEVYILFTA